MGGARRGMSAERLQAMFERLTRIPEMEILGPNQPYDKQRLLFSESEDIQLKVAYDYGRLVYELKVPLARIAPGADLKGGQSIGLGFETTKVDRQAMRQRMGGMGGGMGGRGGGMGGMGGGMGGRGGRRGGGMGGMMAEPFQLWAKVKLASR